jgi:hypothetical protein
MTLHAIVGWLELTVQADCRKGMWRMEIVEVAAFSFPYIRRGLATQPVDFGFQVIVEYRAA